VTEPQPISSPLGTLSRREIPDLVRSQLEALLKQGDLQGAKAILVPVQPVDIAEAIEGMPEAMQAIAFRLLSKQEATEVYEHLDTSVQQVLLEDFKRQDVLDIIGNMSPDDRARLLDELPSKVVRRLRAQLSPTEWQSTALLMGYESGTAGRVMTPEYISVRENMSVSQTLERIRTLSPVAEIIYYLYVMDSDRRLTGIVSLRDLVISSPEEKISEIMTQDVVFVHTDTDGEEVSRLIQRYDFLAIPVVDREQRLVGVITIDDAIDIMEQETTEDIYALGGVQSDGDNYFEMSLWTVARRRVVWLFVLLLTNTVTGSIINSQKDLLQQVVVLTAFIPLLTGTGGNVGAQSSTVVIRGMNTDELRLLGPMKVIFREGIAGALLGTILGTLATIWAYFLLQVNIQVAFCVGVSLIAISILASVAGSSLPFLFRAIKLDPALMSAPFITTAVDVLGVLIYFNLAKLFLGL